MRVRASVSDEQSTIRATAKFWKLRPLETYDECQVSREKGIIVRGSAFVSLQIFISCNSTLGAVTQGTLPPPYRRMNGILLPKFRPVVHARGGALVRRGLGLGLGISFPSYSFQAPLATLLSSLGQTWPWVMSRLINLVIQL